MMRMYWNAVRLSCVFTRKLVSCKILQCYNFIVEFFFKYGLEFTLLQQRQEAAFGSKRVGNASLGYTINIKGLSL